MKTRIWLLLLPLIVLFVAFAIANRHIVTLSLDPAPISIRAPLYSFVLAGTFVGLLAGGLIAWLRAGRWRSQLRDEQRSVRRLESKLRQAEIAATVPENDATDLVTVA